MSVRKLLLLFVLVVVPALSIGETLYLRDGSTLKGRLTKLHADTLYFETSFGAEVKIARRDVLRIDFSDEPPAGGAVVPDAARTSAVAGTLEVHFKNFKLSSSISVRRRGDMLAHERANSIEEKLVVDGRGVFTYVDSLTDKVVKKGPETILKNTIEPRSIRIGLAPGPHACTLFLGNSRAGRYEDRIVGGPLERTLRLDGVLIRPGETTLVLVGLKKKKFGLAGSELYVLP